MKKTPNDGQGATPPGYQTRDKLTSMIAAILEDEFVNPNHLEVATKIVDELHIDVAHIDIETSQSETSQSKPLQYFLTWAYKHVLDKGLKIPTRNTFPTHLMHIVSEAGEADNAWLIDNWEGKDGVYEEMSDLILRFFGLVSHTGIPLEESMLKKMRENDLRPMKHGKVNQ